MGGSRRRLKRSRPKVRIGLPKKKPNVFKPSFSIPAALVRSDAQWDDEGNVVDNYRTFGVVANPNLLSCRSRTDHLVQVPALQVPERGEPRKVGEFEGIDGGSDLETDDLKSALGKKRRDGRKAPPQPLTKIQRVHIGRLVEKYGDDYEAMFRDMKLNVMQHSVGTLRKLCQRYHLAGPNVSRFKIRKEMLGNEMAIDAGTGGGEETS